MLSDQAQMCPISASRVTSFNEQIGPLMGGCTGLIRALSFFARWPVSLLKRAASTAFESSRCALSLSDRLLQCVTDFSPARRVLGISEKMIDGMQKKYGKYTGKARSTAKILPIPHPMVAPNIRCLNSSCPRRLLPRTECVHQISEEEEGYS